MDLSGKKGPTDGVGLTGVWVMARKLWELRTQSSPCSPSPSHQTSLLSAAAMVLALGPILVVRGEGLLVGLWRAVRPLSARSHGSWYHFLFLAPGPERTAHLLSAQLTGVGAALSLNLISLPVLREAQIETAFETLPDFLVPLGTWVTVILAQNTHCACTLLNQGPTQAQHRV